MEKGEEYSNKPALEKKMLFSPALRSLTFLDGQQDDLSVRRIDDCVQRTVRDALHPKRLLNPLVKSKKRWLGSENKI